MYWKLKEEYSILPNWKKPSSQCPANYATIGHDGESIILKKYTLLDAAYFKESPVQYLEDATIEDVNDLVGKECSSMVKKSLPNLLYWKYENNNLLPPQLNIDEFANNPEICQPLKHMFHLTGIDGITNSINESRSTSPQSFKNLLNKVASRTTKHFRSIWKDYKSIQFDLAPNGSNIDLSIKDEYNLFGLSQRSDGFKRFVTFLLMISTKVRTKQLENALILIDEPDINLHPSGARYLRDELINISEKNYVIFSTHSIFMIDSENIQRHIIVKKKKEKTIIDTVNESNIIDEEVIYNALGYSIFENIKKINILFEGWRDKKLFEVALQKPPAEFRQLKDSFKDIGRCHAKGLKDIRHVTPFLQLVNRECYILSDCDQPAQQSQKEYLKSHGYGTWLRYDEILTEIEAVTGEDFIKSSTFNSILKDVVRDNPELSALNETELSHPNGKIYCLHNWLKINGKSDDDTQTIINTVKEKIFSILKPSDIEIQYYEMINSLSSRINQNSGDENT